MLIGVNKQYQIKQIRDITDTSLTVIELDETLETYPFKGWADAKILCYCYKKTGYAISVYPFINTNVIEKLEKQEKENLDLWDIILFGGVI